MDTDRENIIIEVLQRESKMLFIIGQIKEGYDFTAMDCMRAYNEKFNPIDWHSFSDFLDRLHTYGLIKANGINPSGMTKYIK